jgi:hypothetical protein
MIDSFGEQVELTKEDNHRWILKYNGEKYIIEFFDGNYFLGLEKQNNGSDPSYTKIIIYDNAFELIRYVLAYIVD